MPYGGASSDLKRIAFPLVSLVATDGEASHNVSFKLNQFTFQYCFDL
jgi:hypothetical protein